MEKCRYVLMIHRVLMQFCIVLLVSCSKTNTIKDKTEIFMCSYSQDYFAYNDSDFIAGERLDSMKNAFLQKALVKHGVYYVIVDNDSIVSLFSEDEAANAVTAMNKGFSAKELCSEFSITNITRLNTMYRCYQTLGRGSPLSNVDFTNMIYIADTSGEFFPKYLLSQIYRKVDKEKAVELYAELLSDTLAFNRERYAEEFIELIKSKNRLIVIENEHIPFVEYEYDFGNMNIGEVKKATFHYTNVSKYKYLIYNVSTSCGCTVPSWSSLPLAPNCSDSIIVNFEATQIGFVNKQIVINGNTEQRISLSIKANVE